MRHLVAAAILLAAASAAQAAPVRLDDGSLDAVTAAGAQQAAVWKAETTRTVINGREVEQTVIRRLSEVKGKTVEKVVIVIDGRLVQGNRKVYGALAGRGWMPPESPQTRLLVLDDMTLRRALLARFLEDWASQNGLEIALGAVDDLKAQDVQDCALVLSTVGAAAECEQPLAAARRVVAERNPEASLVVIGERSDVGAARRALGVSAAAFIPMTLPEETFFLALDFVRQGGVFYPLDLIKEMVSGPPGPPPRDAIALPGKALPFPAGSVLGKRSGSGEPESILQQTGLTTRQQQVLDCLRLAWSNKEIARRLDMSEATVKMHVRQLMKKLGASNRTHAAVMALRQDPPVVPCEPLRPPGFPLDAAMVREKSRRL